MRRYTLNTGLGALAMLGITTACGTLVVVDRNIAGDDLYYSPVRDAVPVVQASSNGANRYVTDADVAAYDQRVNGYRPAGSVTNGEDTRDFSAMQEYYSNKGGSLEAIADAADTLGIDYNNYESADGFWVDGYVGSDYEQSYAERLIKFHGPSLSVGYYSPLYDNIRYSGNWNVYVDGAGFAYITPRWYNSWTWGAYDSWAWNWRWHGYGHWGLHSSWYWDWGYLGYGYGYYDPWYYGGFGYHGYYGGWPYYHHHYGWSDPWYHHYYNHGYGHGLGHIGSGNHNHNSRDYRYGHRPSSTIAGGGREVNNPRRSGTSQHVNTGSGNTGHSATNAAPAQTNKSNVARDSYRREYTRPSGVRNGQTSGTRTGSSGARTNSGSANKSTSSSSVGSSAPVQHSQTRTAAPRNSDSGSSRSSYTESTSRQSSRSYSSSGSSNKSGSFSTPSSSSHSYSPSRSSSSSSSSYRSSGSYSSGSSYSGGSHTSGGGSYSSGGGRSSGGGGHSSGGGRSGGGRR